MSPHVAQACTPTREFNRAPARARSRMAEEERQASPPLLPCAHVIKCEFQGSTARSVFFAGALHYDTIIILIFCGMLSGLDGCLKCTIPHLITLKNKKDHQVVNIHCQQWLHFIATTKKCPILFLKLVY
jgi:hypothetical protein